MTCYIVLVVSSQLLKRIEKFYNDYNLPVQKLDVTFTSAIQQVRNIKTLGKHKN